MVHAVAELPSVFTIDERTGKSPLAADAGALMMVLVRRMLGLRSLRSLGKMLDCDSAKPYQWNAGGCLPSAVYWQRIVFAISLVQRDPKYWTPDRLTHELPRYWDNPEAHPKMAFPAEWREEARQEALAAKEGVQDGIRPRRIAAAPVTLAV